MKMISQYIHMFNETKKFLAFLACMFSHVKLFCNPMDCSTPGSSVHEISQVRILEWVDIFFSRGSL